MPTYDYECKGCGHEFEAFQTMSEEPLSTCPSCGEESLRRLIGGGTGVIFRGSGFYINDSRSSKNGHNGASGNGNASGGKGASGKGSDGAGAGKESGGSESSSGSSSESSSGSSSSDSSSGNGAGSPKSA
ncbi:MAG: FmdB family zinc ribbon protein [bacterium]